MANETSAFGGPPVGDRARNAGIQVSRDGLGRVILIVKPIGAPAAVELRIDASTALDLAWALEEIVDAD